MYSIFCLRNIQSLKDISNMVSGIYHLTTVNKKQDLKLLTYVFVAPTTLKPKFH